MCVARYVCSDPSECVQDWLIGVSQVLFVDPQKVKTVGLGDKLDAFKDKFDRNLIMEMHITKSLTRKSRSVPYFFSSLQ